ncbi:GyrI-like domain-containing protein [Pseudactinotalea terrae]|uniref:GyrI-like domain-containing protein n=1 Tax=Pseudactinotalea terrae TaxID=1743262 RepID=UPI001391F74B|nr:GyrI-like domain-containing protein [Pseudactinotalea terrae]
MSEIHLTEVLEQPVAAVRRRVRMEELQDTMGAAFEQVLAALEESGTRTAGAPYARYRGVSADLVDVEIGFPVESPFAGAGDVVGEVLPAARVVEAVHAGGYDALRSTYEEIERWMREKGVTPSEEMWEFYESGLQSDPDPANWRTRIVWPVTGLAISRD